MNIGFIGYRGTGKTTISRALSIRMKRERVETDNEIEKRMNLSIPEIVEKKGWDHFRQEEKKVLNSLMGMEDIIIDFGGGAVLHEGCLKEIKKQTIIILLTSPVPVLAERIRKNINRPPLTELSTGKEIQFILNKRRALYRSFADLIIDTGKNGLESCLGMILTYRSIITGQPGSIAIGANFSYA